MSSADENEISLQSQDHDKETKRATINDNKKDGKILLELVYLNLICENHTESLDKSILLN